MLFYPDIQSMSRQIAHVVRTNSTLHWEHWSFLNFLENWNVAGILYLPEQFQEGGINLSNKTESAILGWHMLNMCLHPSAKNKMCKTRNLYSRRDDVSKLWLCRIFMLPFDTSAHLVAWFLMLLCVSCWHWLQASWTASKKKGTCL